MESAFDRKTKVRVLVLLALWVVSFYPIYPSLIYTWLNHSDNSHGILVPFISLYFLWRSKDAVQVGQGPSSRWGLALLAVSMGIYLLSYAGGVAFVSRCMMVFSLAGLLLFCLGKNRLRLMAFPVFFLLFMVPVPDSLLNAVSFPLQLFATKISTAVIHFLSIPAYREGNMLYFAQTQLEVADACSGIRSIVSYLMLSFIFAYLLDRTVAGKALLILSAVPLALFVNMLRITGTGVLANHYGDRVARGFLHEFSGIFVFGIGFILLLLEYLALERRRRESRG